MRILYIFPHPDDESFGPANAMYKQAREGHEVFLLTLTKGGATKKRHDYGYSVEEMGNVRYKEMKKVETVLKLKGMSVLNLPDSGLKNLDPRIIEDIIKDEILRLRPEVVVTYAVHGISGFHDHLVTHAVVKRAYCELKENNSFLKRLAFFTVNDESAKLSNHFKITPSNKEEIKCVISVNDEDISKAHEALDCYETYADVIKASGIKSLILHEVCFELFNEKHEEVLNDLFKNLK
ncbi:MAG: PIG-L family deacetylase [Ignavibacteria bacterium]